MPKIKLSALLGGSLLAILSQAGCNFDGNKGSELKCDSQGCQVCERFTCTDYACDSDYQCPDGYLCSGLGQCKPATSNSGGSGGGGGPTHSGAAQCPETACPEGEICEYGSCVVTEGEEPITTECTLNAQCADAKVCLDGHCTEMPRPTVPTAECKVDGDCGAGQQCLEGSCEAKDFPVRPEGTCQFGLDCGTSGTCLNTKCYFAPKAGACPPGAEVSNGLCLPTTTAKGECALSAECGAGAICINATCRTTCGADADCASGNLCGKDGLCRLDDRPVLQCIVSDDCASGACVDGRCLGGCDAEGACSGADLCTYGYCMPTAACFEKGDCGAGLDCIDGRCGSLTPPPADAPVE